MVAMDGTTKREGGIPDPAEVEAAIEVWKGDMSKKGWTLLVPTKSVYVTMNVTNSSHTIEKIVTAILPAVHQIVVINNDEILYQEDGDVVPPRMEKRVFPTGRGIHCFCRFLIREHPS